MNRFPPYVRRDYFGRHCLSILSSRYRSYVDLTVLRRSRQNKVYYARSCVADDSNREDGSTVWIVSIEGTIQDPMVIGWR